MNARAIYLTLSLLLASTVLAERSPELQVLNRLVGSWENKVEVFGKPPRRSIITRHWTRDGEGDFLFETDVSMNGEEQHVAFWTYAPKHKRYRCVVLKRGGPFLIEGSWDADTETFQFEISSFDQKWSSSSTYRMVDSDHAEFALQFRHAGKKAWAQDGRHVRTARRINEAAVERGPQLQVLQRYAGEWESELDGHKNHRVNSWSRKGQGSFLISEERTIAGSEKYSMLSFDPWGKGYRGCFLEAGAAGFSTGQWDGPSQTMKSEFFLFDLPRDAAGELLPGTSYCDGIHWSISDFLMHKFRRHLSIRISVGAQEVQKVSGRMWRPLNSDSFWPLTLEDGQGLISKTDFKNTSGRGHLLGVGPAAKAIDVFFDGQHLHFAKQPAYSLHVPQRQFVHGTRVIFWYRLNPAPIHNWQRNANATLSPTASPELVLGPLRGEICLVHADHASRLVFAVAP